MSKIGTVCDNYKVDMFKAEFAKAGIEVLHTKPFSTHCSIITCLSEADIIRPIVEKVHAYFKNINNKN